MAFLAGCKPDSRQIRRLPKFSPSSELRFFDTMKRSVVSSEELSFKSFFCAVILNHPAIRINQNVHMKTKFVMVTIVRVLYGVAWSCMSLSVLVFAGCSKSDRPEMVPVSGTVLYLGEPLEGASVRFTGKVGRPAIGHTDANGRFTLTSFDEGDGAVLGEHAVTVTKYAKPSFEPPKKADGGYQFKSEAEMIAFYNRPSLLPARYGNSGQSGLRFTVTAEGANDFTIELTE